MGMYTNVFFAAEVDHRAYTLLRRAEVLRRNNRLDEPFEAFHPFWSTPRWDQVLFGSSAYVAAPRPLQLFQRPWGNAFSFEAGFLTSLKNYDNEAELFFRWVAPHVVNSGSSYSAFVGYTQYEEAHEPTLWFVEAGTAYAERSGERVS